VQEVLHADWQDAWHSLQPPSLSPPLVEPKLIVVMCFFVFKHDIPITAPYHRHCSMHQLHCEMDNHFNTKKGSLIFLWEHKPLY